MSDALKIIDREFFFANRNVLLDFSTRKKKKGERERERKLVMISDVLFYLIISAVVILLF